MEWSLAQAGWSIRSVCAPSQRLLCSLSGGSPCHCRVAPEGWRAEVLAQMRCDEAPTGLERRRRATGRRLV